MIWSPQTNKLEEEASRTEKKIMKKFKIMGVLNLAPDSFYDGDREILVDEQRLISRLDSLKYSDIIDVGCESSRPGANPVSEKEEIKRLSKFTNIVNEKSFFSIDTYKYKVAKYALENGFSMINDIYAGRFDNNKMFEVASDFNVPIVLMHMKGNPENMQKNTKYVSVIDNICAFFEKRISIAKDYGILDRNIILDPGIGFGKSSDDNFRIVKNIGKFKEIGYSVLIGLSRKSFLSFKKDDPSDRLSATISMNTLSILNGADIIRVHDSFEAMKMKNVLTKYDYWN